MRIAEPDNHCACAILAYVQASSTPTQVSPEGARRRARGACGTTSCAGNASAIYAIVEELDLTITQMKALHALADCGREVSVKELADRLAMSLPGRQPHRRRAPAPRLAGAPRGRARPAHEARRHHPEPAARSSSASTTPASPASSSTPPPSPPSSARASRPPSPTSPITHDPHSHCHHRRQPPLVDPRRDVLRAVHDHARQHGRERRAAGDPEGPALARSAAWNGPSTPTR